MMMNKKTQLELERPPSMQNPALVNPFSKAANVKIPDSPPPPEEPESPPGPGKKSKFERLMQAACSIKQNELDNRKRKFELLPAFLKAGVYYTTKLEGVRDPRIPYH